MTRSSGTLAPDVTPTVVATAHAPNLANGLTTFNAGGCTSCHAVPGQPDRLRLGGGLAITSPFRTFYAPNISPDQVDGIGNWTEEQIVTYLGTGNRPDGDVAGGLMGGNIQGTLAGYKDMTPEDLRAIARYLKSIPAVQNKVD